MRQLAFLGCSVLALAACASKVEEVGPGASTGGSVSAAETVTVGTGSSLAADSSAATSGAGGSGSGGEGGAAPIDCSGLEMLASPEEIAKSPRADRTAEHLAREVSGAFVAADDLYARVAADLAAIRALEPAVAGIGAWPDDAAYIGIGWGAEPWPDVATYHAWDCLNEAYEMSVVYAEGESVLLGRTSAPDAVLDTVALAAEYSTLPHVFGAYGAGAAGDGPDVCLEIRDDANYYVFDDAGGDCPVGCNTHIFYGFRVGPDGEAESIGFEDDSDAEDSDPEPTWLADLAACKDHLHFWGGSPDP